MLRHEHRRKALKNLMLLSPTLIFLTSIGTGCGMSYAPLKNTNTNMSGLNSAASSDGAVPPTSGSGARAPYQIKFMGTGYDSHSVTVSTGTTLKVRFIPGKQNSTAQDGKFYAYSMLGIYVGVGTNLQPTELVPNGYGGGAPGESSVIDLSYFVGTQCDSSNPGCRQNVTIVVTKPNDDDGCINLGYTYCPYSHVPDGHPWNGTLVVQTDDTRPI